MTRKATTKPVRAGTAISRQLWASGTGPSNHILLQSMANRKHTTASAENTPMNTASTRKNRSSRVVLRANQYRLAILGVAALSLSCDSRALGARSTGSLIAQLRRDFAQAGTGLCQAPQLIRTLTGFAVR